MDESRLRTDALEALGLDLESTLREEPRFLLDARLLGALHAELEEGLGAGEARVALLQLGFLHGLRDAEALLRSSFEGPALARGDERTPTAPRLALRFSPRPAGAGARALELRGDWPEQREAEAVLGACGARAEPGCAVSAGYTSGWLSGLFEADVLALEEACGSAGADGCRFVAREVEAWRLRTDVRADRTLAALPFALLRERVDRHLAPRAEAASEPSDRFEPGAPVVHVWGPVMVLPFAGVEESQRALQAIAREPAAQTVRVVVVDLSGALVDEGFGALALEQILDAVEARGAEPLLAGVSPLSASVVEELAGSRAVMHKDVGEAIAAAFQVAEAQRHVA